MKRGGWMLAALALPIIGLMLGIGVRQASMHGAEEWRIPIQGYDPRDLLRGQHIRYRYAWQVAGDPRLCRRAAECFLCLERGGGMVRARIISSEQQCSTRVDVRASNISVSRSFGAAGAPTFSTRIFVSETSAPAMEKMLREQPVQIVAALTAEGRLVPQRIVPAD